VFTIHVEKRSGNPDEEVRELRLLQWLLLRPLR
jgi:hypothetical protein